MTSKKTTKIRSPKSVSNAIIYQAKNGAIELKGDTSSETIWATQAQIAEAFDVDVRTVNEHVKNIYKSQELSEKATIRNFRIVQKEGSWIEKQLLQKMQQFKLKGLGGWNVISSITTLMPLSR